MNLIEFNKKTKGNKIGDLKPAIYCNDGYIFSCQASEYHFCEPQEYLEEYKTMELGGWDLDEIDKYEKGGVGMRVPIELIQKMIDTHKGIDVGKTFRNGNIVH